ncbi:MAG: YceI family protein [Rhodothermales bacterium]
MKRLLLISLIAVVLLFTGCRQGDGATPLTSNVIVPANLVKGDTFYVDTSRSLVRWKGTKFWGLSKHEGLVRIASGELYVLGREITGGSFLIDMRSIEVTDIPESDPVPRRRLRDHLMSEDFFSVAAYPTARFVLGDVTRRQGHAYAVTGDLTLRGRTHPITFEAAIPVLSRHALEAAATFSIDRQRWGVAYRGSRLTNDIVDDEIYLDLLLVAEPAE